MRQHQHGQSGMAGGGMAGQHRHVVDQAMEAAYAKVAQLTLDHGQLAVPTVFAGVDGVPRFDQRLGHMLVTPGVFGHAMHDLDHGLGIRSQPAHRFDGLVVICSQGEIVRLVVHAGLLH